MSNSQESVTFTATRVTGVFTKENQIKACNKYLKN